MTFFAKISAGGELLVSKKDAQITDAPGAILKALREEQGYTREQIAERVGIGVRHLAAIENCEKNASVAVLIRIIRALGVSADRIVYPEREMPASDYDRLVRLIRSCDVRDRRAVEAMVNSLLDTKI